MLGLSFKPNTDDLRKTPSIPVLKALIDTGVEVRAYASVVTDNAKKVIPTDVQFRKNTETIIKGVDCLVLLTEWKVIEFGLDNYKAKLKIQ
ncbi:UDP binding domain-containing protein [Robertmurraya massiliosenegalensis]|uniref:UDP binding domain-containing protein n=1 Tax=Robertmurraya massiliosenegalensis TaxID=1287657 RepID=UPI0002D43702|nr:UDP-glucose/GDP-mannose dehydrogenase family protein [Robertmurraya massiliosenegalensis]